MTACHSLMPCRADLGGRQMRRIWWTHLCIPCVQHDLFRNPTVQLFQHVFRIPRKSLGFADCHCICLCKCVQIEDILGDVRSEAVSAPQHVGLYIASHLGLAVTDSSVLTLVIAGAISTHLEEHLGSFPCPSALTKGC